MPENDSGCSAALDEGTSNLQTPQTPTEVLLKTPSTLRESSEMHSSPNPQRPVEAVPMTPLMSSAFSDMKSTPNLQASRTRIETTPLFRQSKISIAVDVSGSTFGPVLRSEVAAVRSICSLFPTSLRSAIKILPWSDVAQRPHSLDELEELNSEGGTNPSVILHDDACRFELQNSPFWFLITDGEIFDSDVRSFARNLVEYGLHGQASVVAIFGEREPSPAKCNISVGLSVFAVSPHCAFLYTDTETGHTYILQTKGCFAALLPKGSTNPILNATTQWTDLPQTSYENLSRVSIPPPQNANKDEVVLQDNLKINLSTLLSDPNVDPQMASLLLDNEDNMKTIALTAKLKGQTEQFRKWLDKVEQIPDDKAAPRKLERPPQTYDETNLLTAAMSNILASEPPPEDVSVIQRQIREANFRDMQCLDLEVERTSQINTPSRRKSSITHARRASATSSLTAEANLSSVDYSSELHQNSKPARGGMSGLPPLPQLRNNSLLQKVRGFENPLQMHTLMNPGFSKPSFQRDFFKGQCMICAGGDSVLALLLRKPNVAEGLSTANFPPIGSSSSLRYPLTMGNYAETDLISSLLACDPCSFRIANKGRLPSGDEISAALPLVSFNKNRPAWLETINLATEKRFSRTDVPQVFLAVLYTKLERLLEEGKSKMATQLRPALNWVGSTLLQEVEVPIPNGVQLTLRKGPLENHLLEMFNGTLRSSDTVGLLQYPIDGFIVANVALSNSLHKTQISAAKRRQIVFQRFLYHLTEQFVKLGSETSGFGDMVRQATMMLILVFDERPGPKSLLNIETLRQFSVHFESREEMMKALQTHMSSQPKKKTKSNKLSISVKDLLDTPFLDTRSLKDFRRLGTFFTWIEDKAAYSIAGFLHSLQCIETTATDAPSRFLGLRTRHELREVIGSPEDMSAKKVENLIKILPTIL
jgi:hypothetical protein